jgi:hypothetical protein
MKWSKTMFRGQKNEEAGQVFPPPRCSPLGETGRSDGGRPAGRVLAYLYNPGNAKKVPGSMKKIE